MNFASDNWAGAHPAIAKSLVDAATEYDAAYGASALDREASNRFNEIFEREVAVFFVGTGTAANALAFTAVNRPGGVVFCHAESHPVIDEGGAAEYLSGGARLHGVRGEHGRIAVDELVKDIGRYPKDFVHHGQPMAVSIAQATELGTVYPINEIRKISAVCRQNDLPLHMDGARFANALHSLRLSPAEASWKAGVDLMSFGATKNGCWCAEALIFFNPEMAREFPFIRKRAGHIFSKSRFVAAQFLAYFENGLWLELAGHANAMAFALADAVVATPNMRLAWNPQCNEVFAIVNQKALGHMRSGNVRFYEWTKPAEATIELSNGEKLVRFVTSFATTDREIEKFRDLAA